MLPASRRSLDPSGESAGGALPGRKSLFLAHLADPALPLWGRWAAFLAGRGQDEIGYLGAWPMARLPFQHPLRVQSRGGERGKGCAKELPGERRARRTTPLGMSSLRANTFLMMGLAPQSAADRQGHWVCLKAVSS